MNRSLESWEVFREEKSSRTRLGEIENSDALMALVRFWRTVVRNHPSLRDKAKVRLLRRYLRILKWVGVGACCVSAAVCGMSEFYRFGFYYGTRCILADNGTIRHVTVHGQRVGDHGFFIERWDIEGGPWRPQGGIWSSTNFKLWFWQPFFIIAITTAGLFYLDRTRIVPGQCQSCGYNLRGNVSGICSECGTPIPEATKKRLQEAGTAGSSV